MLSPLTDPWVDRLQLPVMEEKRQKERGTEVFMLVIEPLLTSFFFFFFAPLKMWAGGPQKLLLCRLLDHVLVFRANWLLLQVDDGGEKPFYL